MTFLVYSIKRGIIKKVTKSRYTVPQLIANKALLIHLFYQPQLVKYNFGVLLLWQGDPPRHRINLTLLQFQMSLNQPHTTFPHQESNYSACRRRGGVLNSPRFCFFFFFFFFSVSEVGAALMGDTAGTNRVSRPKHGV